VYKQRIPRPEEGKAGGYRVIVFFRSGDKTFFQYGFPKSERANISKKELRFHRATAKDMFSLTDEQIKLRLKDGSLKEIERG
jgi:hypothetical protein